MAGRILQDDIEALKRRADLADVVSDYTTVKRAGARFKALCPFHEERTPSLSLDPAQGVWHCFGCSSGGDIYSFLQRIEGLTFVEAVEQLARRVGYQLRYEELSAGQRRSIGERTRLVAVNTAAAEWFHAQLLSEAGTPFRDYLKQRGFGRAEAQRFQLGAAPLEWDALSGHLRGERFAERELIAAGLASRNARGGLRDRFRGRLIFPVLDLNGDVIGFGGRLVPGLGGAAAPPPPGSGGRRADHGEHTPPKYLNTSETPLYHKHRVLYGLSWARSEVVRSGEVLVAEGYTDVLALHQAGFTNAVATCGTAVGAEHVRLLQRYAQRVVLAFDSDEAGARAAERAFELSQEHARGDTRPPSGSSGGLEVRVLVLPDGQDPADLVQSEGIEAMRARVDAAEPVVRFMLRRVTAGHPATPEGRTAAVDAATPLLARIEDPVLRDQYTRLVADELIGISQRVVAAAVAAAGGPATTEVPVPAPPDPGSRPSARATLEREVLRIALQRPELLPPEWEQVEDVDFSHPKARAVVQAVHKAGSGRDGVDLDTVLDAAEDDEVRGLIRAVALEEFTVEPDAPHVRMLVSRLLLHRLERHIARAKTELERINPTTDPDEHRQRFEDLIELEARRRDLRELAAG